MDHTFECVTCKQWMPSDSFYICKSHGIPRRKHSCKLCFNLKKNHNIRRKKFLEMTEKIAFKKYAWFKDTSVKFSDDAEGALREGDIYN